MTPATKQSINELVKREVMTETRKVITQWVDEDNWDKATCCLSAALDLYFSVDTRDQRMVLQERLYELCENYAKLSVYQFHDSLLWAIEDVLDW